MADIIDTHSYKAAMQVPDHITYNPGAKNFNGSDADSDNDSSIHHPNKSVSIETPPPKLTLTELQRREREKLKKLHEQKLQNSHNVTDMSRYSDAQEASLHDLGNRFYKELNGQTGFDLNGTPKENSRSFVKSLAKRIEELEKKSQNQYNQQVFIIGILSVYFIAKGIKMIIK